MISPDTESKISLEIFNIRDLINVCKEYKEYLLIPIVVSVLIAFLYGLLATPIYRANIILSTADEDSQNLSRIANQYSTLARFAGVNIGGIGGSSADKSAINLAILTSRKFIEQHVTERELRPIIFSDSWDEKKNKWINDAKPSALQTYEYVTENIIDYTIDRRTGLIYFTVDWDDPNIAAEWANNIINDLNNHIRQQAIEEIEKNIFFLEQQLKLTTQVNAQSVMFSLIEEQTKNIMLANVREEYAFKIIDPAVRPEMKIKPKRTNILIMGFIVGIFIGFLSVLLRNFYDKELA